MGEWEMVRLGDVGRIITGNTPKTSESSNFDSDDIPFFKPGDFSDVGITFLDSANNYISNNAKSKVRLIPANSILITCIGIIGKVGRLQREASCNQQINAIIPDEKICCGRYIAYAVMKKRRQINHIANAAVVPIINKTQFSNICIPLPPLPIQHQIADVIDRASALIEKRKAQIAKLDLLVKSQFIEMFGDPVSNPMGWKKLRLDKLGELNRGVSKHRPRNDPKLLGGKFPLIQTGDVANSDLFIIKYSSTYSELGLKQSKLWKAGVLCITIAANIAKTGILTFDACFPDSVVGFLPFDQTNTFFIYYWVGFLQKMLEDQAPESAQKNINLKILSELDVICPPLALQTKFADFVQQVEAQKSLLQQSLAQLEQNYKSLMQKCFRGEIF